MTCLPGIDLKYLTSAQLFAILSHEDAKVALNWSKARLQLELKKFVNNDHFEKRIDVRACPHHGSQGGGAWPGPDAGPDPSPMQPGLHASRPDYTRRKRNRGPSGSSLRERCAPYTAPFVRQFGHEGEV